MRPQYIEAKKHHQDVKWAGDKIIVNKRVIKVPKDKIRTINYVMEDKAAQMRTINTPPRCYDGSTFQGQCVRLESQDDVIAGLHAVRKDTRVARADHNAYAYRWQGADRYISEHYEDDREYGSGRWVLDILREQNLVNYLVVVSRWFGGKHLGQARFDNIKEAAMLVLQEL